MASTLPNEFPALKKTVYVLYYVSRYSTLILVVVLMEHAKVILSILKVLTFKVPFLI